MKLFNFPDCSKWINHSMTRNSRLKAGCQKDRSQGQYDAQNPGGQMSHSLIPQDLNEFKVEGQTSLGLGKGKASADTGLKRFRILKLCQDGLSDDRDDCGLHASRPCAKEPERCPGLAPRTHSHLCALKRRWHTHGS